MSIRTKLSSIAFLFLVIFGIVVGVSTVMQRRLARQVESTVEYNAPIGSLVSEFDVLSDEYELIVLRLVRRADVPSSEVESETARARKDADRMADDLRQIKALMERATTDQSLPDVSRSTPRMVPRPLIASAWWRCKRNCPLPIGMGSGALPIRSDANVEQR